MSADKLGKKYTLKSILEMFDRIEIPVIQRDYAQGRTGKQETKIRQGLLDHILGALIPEAEPAELDFVYGIEQPFAQSDGSQGVSLIPIDGQQRLTTLWLIHCYLAGRAGLLREENSLAKKMLLRFMYETRVSSKDFMRKLCEGEVSFSANIRNAIMEDAPWFDEAWKLDPSVMGFLAMLDAIAKHPVVKGNDPRLLYERLTADEPAVSFYFLSLEKFGLGEEIYTRMNARGKILSDFERFKSNFFKIIEDSERKNEISQKLEYEWVENLWRYQQSGSYVTDAPFMNWLRYITMMLIATNAPDTKAETDFLDMDLLARTYSVPSNLDFLIHSLDSIPTLASASMDCSLDWDDKKGLEPAIKKILEEDNPNTDGVTQLCVFAALLYIRDIPNCLGLGDYVRVTRNLIANTSDRSMREWPAIIKSVSKIILDDVYTALLTPGLQLHGLRAEQREIELFKARMIAANPQALELIAEMDEDSGMKAREGNLIIEMSEPEATASFTISLSQIDPATVDCGKLKKYFAAYRELQFYDNTNGFNGIWGEMLQTCLYTFNNEYCWLSEGNNSYVDYAIHPEMMKLVRQVAESGIGVDAMLERRQRTIINGLLKRTQNDLAALTDPKDQLYLLYVATTRILGKSWKEFFARQQWNFGWVENQSGYTSPFKKLLDSSHWKIYQTYSQRFRSDAGVVPKRTPYIMGANSRGRNFFEKIVKWTNPNIE